MRKEELRENVLLLIAFILLVFIIKVGNEVDVTKKPEIIKNEITTEQTVSCEVPSVDCLFIGCSSFF